MSEATQIHVVQVQDSNGHWDLHGAAFVDENKCRAFVANLDIEWIMDQVPDEVILEALLNIPEEDVESHLETLGRGLESEAIIESLLNIPEEDVESHLETLGRGLEAQRNAIEAALRKVDRQDICEFFDAHERGQIGGVHSWETVEINDGLDIHTRRNTG